MKRPSGSQGQLVTTTQTRVSLTSKARFSLVSQCRAQTHPPSWRRARTSLLHEQESPDGQQHAGIRGACKGRTTASCRPDSTTRQHGGRAVRTAARKGLRALCECSCARSAPVTQRKGDGDRHHLKDDRCKDRLKICRKTLGLSLFKKPNLIKSKDKLLDCKYAIWKLTEENATLVAHHRAGQSSENPTKP